MKIVVLLFITFVLAIYAKQDNEYYEMLEIKRSATLSQIDKAYRKMVFKYHPDIYVGEK